MTPAVVFPRTVRMLAVSPTAVVGGAENVLLGLLRERAHVGLEVSVVVVGSGPLTARIEALGVEVLDAPSVRLRRVGSVVACTRAIGRACDATGAQVVFSNMPKAQILAAGPARRRRLPTLWHQASVPSPPHLFDRLATATRAASVMAVSGAGRSAQQALAPRSRVTTVFPGIDPDEFRPDAPNTLREQHGIASDAPLVTIVGRLQKWKGQEAFLRAAAIVRRQRPDVRFAVVGGAVLGWEGDYPASLRALARSLDIDDATVFTGDTDQVPSWLAESDIVVNASDPEPFGLVVVEAMSAGCVVIAVAAGGPLDVIEDGVTGLLVAAPTPALIADRVSAALGDPALAARLGSAARRDVELRWNTRRMAIDFRRMVDTAVAGSARSWR